MRAATKSSLYRNEVTEAAVAAVREALANRGRRRADARPLVAADVRAACRRCAAGCAR